jgi:hypothetical protein
MDLALLLYIGREMEQSLLLLIYGLMLAIPVISVIPVIPAISTIGCVDLPIVLLFIRGPIATWFKEPSSGLGGLNAYIGNYEKINYRLGLLHGNLLNSFDISHLIVKGIDDLNVLYVRDSIPGVPEIFHVVPEALIMLLLNGLQGLCYRRKLVHTMEVSDEYGT